MSKKSLQSTYPAVAEALLEENLINKTQAEAEMKDTIEFSEAQLAALNERLTNQASSLEESATKLTEAEKAVNEAKEEATTATTAKAALEANQTAIEEALGLEAGAGAKATLTKVKEMQEAMAHVPGKTEAIKADEQEQAKEKGYNPPDSLNPEKALKSNY